MVIKASVRFSRGLTRFSNIFKLMKIGNLIRALLEFKNIKIFRRTLKNLSPIFQFALTNLCIDTATPTEVNHSRTNKLFKIYLTIGG